MKSAPKMQIETPSQISAWLERKFEFNFPVAQYLTLCIRLSGTPARLEEMVRRVSREVLVRKVLGKWSAQEHAGHLLDLESLWMSRVDDFLNDQAALTAADLTNRRTNEADHNVRQLSKILKGFRAARVRLIDRLVELPPSRFGRSKVHPRLNQPMRLVDHLYFVAEHDDHHLARIWEMAGAESAAAETD